MKELFTSSNHYINKMQNKYNILDEDWETYLYYDEIIIIPKDDEKTVDLGDYWLREQDYQFLKDYIDQNIDFVFGYETAKDGYKVWLKSKQPLNGEKGNNIKTPFTSTVTFNKNK